MNPLFPRIVPVLPEIVLALGAMALLMLGAYRERQHVCRQSAAPSCCWSRPPSSPRLSPTAATFGGSFVVDGFARFLKILAFIGSAVAILMSLDYLAAERQQNFEYPILILLSTRRHGDADLGRRPDRALSRARADGRSRFTWWRHQSRQRALDRGRA